MVDENSGRQLHHIGDLRFRDGSDVFVLATKANQYFSPVDEGIAAALSDLAVATDTVAGETAIVDGVPQANPGHMKSWLPHDILIVEMLTNLEELTPRSLFLAMPPNIDEGSGSPIRPVAFCPA